MKTILCSQCKNEINADDVICMHCGCPNYAKREKEDEIENDMQDIKRVRHTKKDPITGEEVLDTEEVEDTTPEEEIELPEESLPEDEEETPIEEEEAKEEEVEEKPKRVRKTTTKKTTKKTTTTRKRRTKKEEESEEDVDVDRPIELKAEVEKISKIIKKESMGKPVKLKDETPIDDIINGEEKEDNDDEIKEMLVETPVSLEEEKEELEKSEEIEEDIDEIPIPKELPLDDDEEEEEEIPEVETKEEEQEPEEEIIEESKEEEKEEEPLVPEETKEEELEEEPIAPEEPKEEEKEIEEAPKEEVVEEEKEEAKPEEEKEPEEEKQDEEKKPAELKEELSMDEIINDSPEEKKRIEEAKALEDNEKHSVIMEEKVVKTFYSPSNIIEATSELILKYETKEEVIRNMMNDFHLDRGQAENYFELAIKTVKTKLEKISFYDYDSDKSGEVQLADMKYVNYVNSSLKKTRDVEELAKLLMKEYTELDFDTALVIADQVKKKFNIKIGIIACIVILVILIVLLIVL